MAARIISTLAFLSLLGYVQACVNLTKPLELDNDYSSIMGRWIFTEAFANHDSFTDFLGALSSSWVEFAPSPERDTIILSNGHKLNGTCYFVTVNSTIKNNTFYATVNDVTFEGDFLQSCPDCLTISFTSKMQNETIKSLYLFTKTPKVTKSEKHLYWKQAPCYGFEREPHFFYDGVTELCEKTSSAKDETKPGDKKED